MSNLTELNINIDEKFSNYVESMSVLNTMENFCIYSVYDKDYDDYSTTFGNVKQIIIKVRNNDINRGVMCAICDAHKNGYEKIIILTNKVIFNIDKYGTDELFRLMDIYNILYMNPFEDNDCLMMDKTAIDFISTYNVNIDRHSWKTIVVNRINSKLSVGKTKYDVLRHFKQTQIEVVKEKNEVRKYNDEIIKTTVENNYETYESINNIRKKEEIVIKEETPVVYGSPDMNNVVVWVYTLCYNEEKVLPFIIDYWKKYATRVFVYDNGSTDNSINILEQYDWIEVRHFDSSGFDDEINKNMKNQIWKEAKGKGVDFVQVCDIDEVIWAEDIKNELLNFKRSNAVIWDCKCYNIVTREFPEYDGGLLNDRDGALCAYDKIMSKKLLFKPDYVNDMNYSEGCHSCKPVGLNMTLYSNDNIKMFHIRNLGLEYLIEKYRHNQKRLSDNNKKHGWGIHYNFSDFRIRKEFEKRLSDGIEIKSSRELKVAVCAIAKYENHYIREWVEHYKKLKVTNIILYDNNDPDGERFEDVINDYIESGFVIIKDVRGKKSSFEWRNGYTSLQIDCYDECYHEYADEYDWFGFFDIDEFVMLDNNLSIPQQLKDNRYNQYDGIKICWKYYDDNNLTYVVNDNYKCVSRFTHHNPVNDYNNKQCKMFIRTGKVQHINSPHCVASNNKYYQVINVCDVLGNRQNNESHNLINDRVVHTVMWLNHYRFKTIEEYVRFKCVRKWPDDFAKFANFDFDSEIFFKYNRKTLEKQNYYSYAANMKFAVCGIAKNENRYIREWVEYYKNLGVDKVIICDNNDIGGERFEDVIQDYISSGFVTIENYRGRRVDINYGSDNKSVQGTAYLDIYKKYKSHYDWIAYFDIDEFLYMGKQNLKDFFMSSKYMNLNGLRIYWYLYGDNGHIHYENKPVLERFDTENNKAEDPYHFYKTVVRNNIRVDSNLSFVAHGPNKTIYNIPDINLNKISHNMRGVKINNPEIYLKHFYTKSTEEFFTRKYKKTSAVCGNKSPRNYNINYLMSDKISEWGYFKTNKKTSEKLKFIEDFEKNSR